MVARPQFCTRKAPLREKELRIALVCFGGVSLAVYMHGVSKEILKLARASAALHAIRDRTVRREAQFFDRVDRRDTEYDTEPFYFELLREIGGTIDLRVIVDIIAGASAGGINGTMLARALAYDLRMGPLRDLWLTQADVTELLAPEARARGWSKMFMLPFIWGFATTRWLIEIRDREVRRKLSLFVRSRWFKPPFDGLRMAQLMYDGVLAMGEPAGPDASLLPLGHQLDLFVTATDYWGYRQALKIHDPPVIQEREHQRILHFRHRRWPSGEVETDFARSNAPALAFAARATSSFPGAFPPAQLAEIERLLGKLGVAWPERERFIASCFGGAENGAGSAFIDGAVVSNKPFREAIRAIRGRAAYRQVNRRILYIDPDPEPAVATPTGEAPGFFTTLKGALSDIPRSEPVGTELLWVAGFNERVRRQKAIIEAARPRVTELVAHVAARPFAPGLTAEELGHWREAANLAVAREAGFAYEGYVRLKLASIVALIAQIVAGMLGVPAGSPAAARVAEALERWAEAAGVSYRRIAGGLDPAIHPLPRWARLLQEFDLDFRKRRLYFLIQGQNRIYQMLDAASASSASAAAVDRLKRDFYRCLEELRRSEAPEFFGPATRDAARALFAGSGEPDHTEIGALIDRLAAEMDLDATTREIETLLAALDGDVWPENARREVIVNYLGFPFWDMLTLSITNWRDVEEYDEILVDRISPADAPTINSLATATNLKGIGFGHFAAFFSRAYRENDYLLGRLHAIDRLIDIVCDAVSAEGACKGLELPDLKRRAFAAVLDAEAPHLPRSADLIATLRRELGSA
jgi:patatin-related protein